MTLKLFSNTTNSDRSQSSREEKSVLLLSPRMILWRRWKMWALHISFSVCVCVSQADRLVILRPAEASINTHLYCSASMRTTGEYEYSKGIMATTCSCAYIEYGHIRRSIARAIKSENDALYANTMVWIGRTMARRFFRRCHVKHVRGPVIRHTQTGECINDFGRNYFLCLYNGYGYVVCVCVDRDRTPLQQ